MEDLSLTPKQRRALSSYFERYHSELREESERGCAIVAAVVIEDILEEMIQYKLLPSIKTTDELIRGYNAPLGSFSAKIDLAFRLGIIRENVRKCLHIIRKIRNSFAHKYEEISFDRQPIINQVMELKNESMDILTILFEEIKKDANISRKIPEIENMSRVHEFVQILSHRRVFQLYAANTAAALMTFKEDIEPLNSQI